MTRGEERKKGGGLKEEVKSSLAETPPTRSKKTDWKWLRGKRDFPERGASTEILDLRAELLKWQKTIHQTDWRTRPNRGEFVLAQVRTLNFIYLIRRQASIDPTCGSLAMLWSPPKGYFSHYNKAGSQWGKISLGFFTFLFSVCSEPNAFNQ